MKKKSLVVRLISCNLILAAFVVSALLAGCGKGPEKSFKKGQKAYAAGNFEEAAKYLDEAVYKGKLPDDKWGEAMFLLGSLYLDGKGIEKDADEALDLFKDAAEVGNPKAKCMVFILDPQTQFRSDSQNFAVIKTFEADLKKLAEANDNDAQVLYGMICAMKGDNAEAMKWMEKAEKNKK